MPAHKPEKAYTEKIYLLTLIPANRLATALIPMDSINIPIAVLRTAYKVMAKTSPTINREKGNPNKYPVPIN